MSDGNAYDDPARSSPTTRRGRRARLRPRLPRRRRRKKEKKRGFSGCLAVLVALVVVLGGAYVVGTKGFHFLKDHLSHSADYSGPGHGQVLFEVKQGESTSTIGRNLKADGRRGVGGRVHQRLEQQEHHPGRLLPAEEEDVGGRGVQDPRQPQEHRQGHRHDPRGPSARRHRRDPGGQDEVLRGRLRQRAEEHLGARACRRTPTGRPRATSSRRPTASGPRRSRSTCSPTWSTGGSRPRWTTTWSRARSGSARRRPR